MPVSQWQPAQQLPSSCPQYSRQSCVRFRKEERSASALRSERKLISTLVWASPGAQVIGSLLSSGIGRTAGARCRARQSAQGSGARALFPMPSRTVARFSDSGPSCVLRQEAGGAGRRTMQRHQRPRGFRWLQQIVLSRRTATGHSQHSEGPSLSVLCPHGEPLQPPHGFQLY